MWSTEVGAVDVLVHAWLAGRLERRLVAPGRESGEHRLHGPLLEQIIGCEQLPGAEFRLLAPGRACPSGRRGGSANDLNAGDNVFHLNHDIAPSGR